MNEDEDLTKDIHAKVEELVLLCKEHDVMIQHIDVDWQEIRYLDGKLDAILCGIEVETRTFPFARRKA